MTLYLHSGTVKTGTSYIQKVLHENRAVFARHGLTYLPVSASDLELPRYANAKFLYDASLVQEILRLIENCPTKNILISEEGMFGNVQNWKNSVFNQLEKRIILYVRPTSEIITAWAVEFCHPYNVVDFSGHEIFHPTNRCILQLDDALNVASHEYAISIGRFMNIVDEIGREQITIRPYERASFFGEDLLTDFLANMDIDADAVRADPEFQDPGPTNLTPNRKYCDVSHALWLKLGRPHELSKFNHALVKEISLACTTGDKRQAIETLKDSQIEWFTSRFDHFESYISKTFTNGKKFFRNKYPSCYGLRREPYAQLNVRELDLILDLIDLRNQY